jgi:hypothetical protein
MKQLPHFENCDEKRTTSETHSYHTKRHRESALIGFASAISHTARLHQLFTGVRLTTTVAI